MSKVSDTLHPPQAAALDAIAGVLEKHLRVAKRDRRRVPLIVQLDGFGSCEMLDALGGAMSRDGVATRTPAREPWTVVRFDAWQHQRLAPPWWWLVQAVDRGIRDDARPRLRRLRDERGHAIRDELLRALLYPFRRARNVGWHVLQLRHDLLRLTPYVLLAGILWALVGSDMNSVLATATTTLAGLAVLVAAVMGPIRRRLLLSANREPAAFLRSSDPMADLRKRYAFLLRTVRTPVLVLVDNLDRCHAAYVIDLLEGLQTLLRHPGADGERLSFVAFIVAADRDWLCHSFLQQYRDFERVAQQPGRPFGEAFLENVFDLEARMPTVPVALTGGEVAGTQATADEIAAIAKTFESAATESEVRALVCEAEAASPRQPRQAYRIEAVRRLGQIEYGDDLSVCPLSTQYQCDDTRRDLEALVKRFDAAAAMLNRIDTVYCVHRTTQLLGGHEIANDDHPIRRLGMWAVLCATWPLLAQHLASHPGDVDRLRDGGRPATRDAGLRAVFADWRARQLAAGIDGVVLTAKDVRRYCAPRDEHAGVASRAHNGSVRSGADRFAEWAATMRRT